MQLSDFDFDLPEELIALRPAAKRDFSRLLEVNPAGNSLLNNHVFKDLPNLLKKGDCLVFNVSRTLPANLKGIRKKRDENGNDIEININLHKRKNENSWWAFAKPAKRLKINDIIEFGESFFAKLIHKNEDGDVLLEFSKSEDALIKALNEYGNMPIPPYIEQRRAIDARDKEDYQTIYSKKIGSVATATAGLHFTQEVLNRLDEIGVERHEIILHVGAGTFLPVKTENIQDHKMHHEYYEISKSTAEALNKAKSQGRRIIAIGTTSLRTLESACGSDNYLNILSGDTNIFIYPSKNIKFVDGLVSNFHLPKSTLFMLMCAFSGIENAKLAYKYAIENKYRFYSYGDCGLWWKK